MINQFKFGKIPTLATLFIVALVSIFPSSLFAYDFNVDGIYYNKLNVSEVEVAENYLDYYIGDVSIPQKVSYNGVTYTVTAIGNDAFSMSSVTSVSIPNSVTSIGASAFRFCSTLQTIDIPNSVTSIGKGAFANCGLKSISIPYSVTSIEYSTFSECWSLVSVDLPNTITTIGEFAFASCSSLKSIVIPNSVVSIGRCAFSTCYSLESVNIPDNITTIKDSTFEICNSLKSINIPNSVTSIEDCAFRGCGTLTSITIPNSVSSIGDSAFSACEALTSIIIPDSVKHIGSYAFGECESLTSVTSLSVTPPILEEDAFEVPSDAILYVKESVINDYKASDWSNYFAKIQAIDESGVERIESSNIKISVRIFGNAVEILNLEEGETISIFNTEGRCEYKGKNHTVTLDFNNVYILCTEKETLKFAL